MSLINRFWCWIRFFFAYALSEWKKYPLCVRLAGKAKSDFALLKKEVGAETDEEIVRYALAHYRYLVEQRKKHRTVYVERSEREGFSLDTFNVLIPKDAREQGVGNKWPEPTLPKGSWADANEGPE